MFEIDKARAREVRDRNIRIGNRGKGDGMKRALLREAGGSTVRANPTPGDLERLRLAQAKRARKAKR